MGKVFSGLLALAVILGIAWFYPGGGQNPSPAPSAARPQAPAPITVSTSLPSARGPASASPDMASEAQAQMKNLGRVMNELQAALDSESKAATVLGDLKKCLTHPEADEFRSVVMICAQNARLIGERFPALKDRAIRISALGGAGTDAHRTVAPPLNGEGTPATR